MSEIWTVVLLGLALVSGVVACLLIVIATNPPTSEPCVFEITVWGQKPKDRWFMVSGVPSDMPYAQALKLNKIPKLYHVHPERECWRVVKVEVNSIEGIETARVVRVEYAEGVAPPWEVANSGGDNR